MNVYANPNDKSELIVKPESLLEYLVVLGINTDDYPPAIIRSAEKVGSLVIRGIGTLIKVNSDWNFLLDSSIDFITVNIKVHEK